MYNVAIAGATGAVGEELLRVIEEYEIPVKNKITAKSPNIVFPQPLLLNPSEITIFTPLLSLLQ